jgi:hypothetical protein
MHRSGDLRLYLARLLAAKNSRRAIRNCLSLARQTGSQANSLDPRAPYDHLVEKLQNAAIDDGQDLGALEMFDCDDGFSG